MHMYKEPTTSDIGIAGLHFYHTVDGAVVALETLSAATSGPSSTAPTALTPSTPPCVCSNGGEAFN